MAEHLNVIIVGAGLSGVGAACHLQRSCPGKSVAILEGRNAVGGTWDLFRYPGVRSDSDMFTLGYSFRPWTEEDAIAGGGSIRSYIEDTAREFNVVEKIRMNHRVTAADWDSDTALWTVTVAHTDVDEVSTLTCDYLWMCTGYYRYDEGFTPIFPGSEQFAGPIVHPQHWPEDLDYSGQRVVVIGSGATAVTLVPAMAATAGHVTMLQRSPSYVIAAPLKNPLAALIRRRLSQARAAWLLRWIFAVFGVLSYQFSRRRPKAMKEFILKGAAKQLPGFDLSHFTPSYNPWDQRMCLIPDGDLFTAVREGKASVVTDTIEAFTATGIRLSSGQELDADIIVTATGLNLLMLGGTEISVDGKPINLGETVSYKGMMLSGVPNMSWTMGYTNASWTLKADLVSRYVCRLLNHMDANHYASATPVPPTDGASEPFLDLTSGYVQRSMASFPKQGAVAPWRLHQNYLLDVRLLGRGPIDDEIVFAHRQRVVAPAAAAGR